jgi:hypothetical protein
MFWRRKIRRKDGKDHRAWSVVENRRVAGGCVVQRPVSYLGEINDSQQSAQIALFPGDRRAPVLDCDVVWIRLSGMRLRRPRQWGSCWRRWFCGVNCCWMSSGARSCRPRGRA